MSVLFMIASNSHGSPSLMPGSDCGPVLTLPETYLHLMFGRDGDAGRDLAPSIEVVCIPASQEIAEAVG